MRSDKSILATLNALSADAYAYQKDTLDKQATLLDYYDGEPFGNEEEGRSQVISTEVADVVDGMLPSILKPFVSSDDVVMFSPVAPDDVQAAEQETDYVRWIVTRRNNAFLELYQWCKTGLLQTVGIVKYWWDTKEIHEIERYRGVDEQTLAAFMSDPKIKILSAVEVEGPMGKTFDIECRETREYGYPRYEAVPPEEIRISSRTKNIQIHEADFVEHRCEKTISEIRQMGYDVEDSIPDEGLEDETLQQARDEDYDESDKDVGTREMRRVTFREIYARIDLNDDGIAELRKFCIVGSRILASEEAEEIPFRAWTPYIMPFRFAGSSPAEKVADLQLIKSTLLRNALDNVYTLNNNRYAVSENVNMPDLLNNAVNGIVRVKSNQVGNDIVPLPVQPIIGAIQPMMQYMDYIKDNRVGWSRASAGLDPNSINKTATEINVLNENQNQQVELIARTFAETGVAPLMLAIHGLCRRYANKTEMIRLRGTWTPVDPRTWKHRMDMTISVGLGNASQTQKKQDFMMVLQMQKEALMARMATPSQVYNGLKSFMESIGRKDAEQFFTDPGPNLPPPPPPPEVMVEQMRQQAEAQKMQFEQQAKEREMQFNFQLEKERMNMQAELDRHRQQVEAEQQALKLRQEAELEMLRAELKAQSDARTLEFKKWEVEFKAGKTHELARFNAGITAGTPMDEIDLTGEQSTNVVREMLQTLAITLQPKRRVISVTFDENGNAIGESVPVE